MKMILIGCLLLLWMTMGCDSNKAQQLAAVATAKYNESMRGTEKYKADLKLLSPTQLVEKFYTFWDEGNLAGMLACCKKDSRVYNEFVKVATVQKDSNRIKILNDTINGNSAELLIEKFDLSPDKKQVWMSWKMKISLVKDGDAWEITDLVSAN